MASPFTRKMKYSLNKHIASFPHLTALDNEYVEGESVFRELEQWFSIKLNTFFVSSLALKKKLSSLEVLMQWFPNRVSNFPKPKSANLTSHSVHPYILRGYHIDLISSTGVQPCDNAYMQ